jgi:hypothetical protein
MRHWRKLLSGLVIVGLLTGLSLAEPAGDGYSPVVPATSVHAALQSTLKTVRDWLNDKDYASAAEAGQALTALAHLYTYQGSQPGWREKTTALAETSTRLTTAAQKKDAAACTRLVQECTRLLEDLSSGSPGDRPLEKNFKPHGSTKTWMTLMDWAYGDAKTAKQPQELEQLAQAIAEEANAVQFQRTEARWRQSSLDVRAAALEVAETAKAKDLAAAKTALKTVYNRCEACHEGYRRRP